MSVRLKGVEPSKRGLVVQLLVKFLLPYLRLIKCTDVAQNRERRGQINDSKRMNDERLMHLLHFDSTAYQRSG